MSLDNESQMDNLLVEIESLKMRVANLESQLHLNQPRTEASMPISTQHLSEGMGGSKKVPQTNYRLSQRFSENFIGGKLLNRIGALIVVFAMAYFLKWSFDNDIIGELGRCVLGLAVGMALMGAGQIYFKKGFSTFSQGLSGAGIAIIYLSTYAAVNYYHLISPYIAFALMFLTALTAGILAALGNMSGTAVMATVGGFLVPFLMGSHTSQTIPLLSYILILDLGILFLAYYRQWFFLDVLALIGTGMVSIIAYNSDWNVWGGQAFLTAFIILFIIVAVIYNHRSRDNNMFLLLSSTLLLSIFSFVNLYEKMENWLGLLCLIFAAIYLVTYWLISIKALTTALLTRTVLIIAMIFSFLAAPVQLQGVYSQMAWLAIAAAGLYLSTIIYKTPAFIFSLGILIITLFSIDIETYARPFFNNTNLQLSLSALTWFWALAVSVINYPHLKKITLVIEVVVVGIIFYLLDYDISNAVYYYQANHSFAFLIPIAWALVSSLILWMGVRRDDLGIRMLSLLLYGVVIARTIFYDLSQLDIVFKIMVLFIIGLIALAVSFFYQQRMRGDEVE